jgi:hypothetical protein
MLPLFGCRTNIIQTEKKIVGVLTSHIHVDMYDNYI